MWRSVRGLGRTARGGEMYEEVLGVNFIVLWEVVILFGDEYAL